MKLHLVVCIIALGLFHSSPKVQYLNVTATAYNAEVSQTDSTPLITASNIRVREGIIAISRDLERDYNLTFGDRVYIIGLGEYEVQDRMNRRFKRRVDLFMWSKKAALKFGKQYFKIMIPVKDMI